MPDIAANVTVTSLADIVDVTDGVITLWEVVALSLDKISWQAITPENIEAGTYGLDPVTLQVVVKEDMTAGKTYYRTGYYNGTEAIGCPLVYDFASLFADSCDFMAKENLSCLAQASQVRPRDELDIVFRFFDEIWDDMDLRELDEIV